MLVTAILSIKTLKVRKVWKNVLDTSSTVNKQKPKKITVSSKIIF